MPRLRRPAGTEHYVAAAPASVETADHGRGRRSLVAVYVAIVAFVMLAPLAVAQRSTCEGPRGEKARWTIGVPLLAGAPEGCSDTQSGFGFVVGEVF